MENCIISQNDDNKSVSFGKLRIQFFSLLNRKEKNRNSVQKESFFLFFHE
jgi:hypothetical protein